MSRIRLATVFNVQRYSLHDGPGIRTVIFLKGCSLACGWCANPESINGFREVMFSPDKCIDCGICLDFATNGEVTPDPKGKVILHRENIKPGALQWAENCPTGALRVYGQRRTVDDLVAEAARDKLFFDRSGGGVTFSGGEPLLQALFVAQASEELHRLGITTAVETCGNVQLRALKVVEPHMDLYLCDLKLLDDSAHQLATGGTNQRVLDTIRYLGEHHAKRTMVRTPLIPDVNMASEQIEANIAFLCSVGVRHYDVLPFHRLGTGKYTGLGREYSFAHTETPPEELVEEYRNRIRAAGLSTEFPETVLPPVSNPVALATSRPPPEPAPHELATTRQTGTIDYQIHINTKSPLPVGIR